MIKYCVDKIKYIGAIFALSPFILMYGLGYPLSLISNCLLESGAYKNCIFFGNDISDFINIITVLGWFSLITIPVGLLLYIVGIVLSGLLKK